MSLPVLVSIFEVAAFKSVDLPLQVGQGVADLSPATHLGKTFYRKDNFRESKFKTNPILDVKKYMVGLNLKKSHQLSELLPSVNVGHPLLCSHTLNTALKSLPSYLSSSSDLYIFKVNFGLV